MSREKVLKLFSTDGRIYQVEYAFKAVHTFGLTSIAVRGTDTVVTCIQKKVPEKLIVPDSVTSTFNIIDSVGAVVVGNPNDARFMITRLRQECSEFKMKMGYEIPVRTLAEKLASMQ